MNKNINKNIFVIILIAIGANIYSMNNNLKIELTKYSYDKKKLELFNAVKNNDIETTKALISAMRPTEKSCHKVIEILANSLDNALFYGYINSKDKNDWTPLHHACNNDNKEIVELLLVNSADKTIKNNRGKKAADLSKTKEIKELVNRFNYESYLQTKALKEQILEYVNNNKNKYKSNEELAKKLAQELIEANR